MLNIVLFGAPGTGKGTQAGLLIEKYRMAHFSTGDMLRKAIKERTPVGIEAKGYIDEGLLVPDDIIIQIVQAAIADCQNCKGLIFDGFPRTIVQADALDSMLKNLGTPISLVFYLDVAEDELFKRILGRAKSSDRTDDNMNVIHKRIKVYNDQTFPLLEYYRKQGKCIDLNGMRGIEDVFAQICENIDYYKETHK
jgi:adenylate kinase